MVDLSKMGLVNPRRIGPAAMTSINQLQCQYTPEEQCAALALTFLMVCKRHRCHPGSAMAIAENVLKSDLWLAPEVRACRMYLENET